MVVTYFAHFKMTEGYEEIETETAGKKNDKTKITIREMFASLFQNPPLMVLMLADLAKWCVKFVTAASAIYYFRDAMGNPGLMTTYLLWVAIGAIIGAFSMRYIAKAISSRTIYDHRLCRNGSITVSCIYFYGNAMTVIALMTLAQFFMAWLLQLHLHLCGYCSVLQHGRAEKMHPDGSWDYRIFR